MLSVSERATAFWIVIYGYFKFAFISYRFYDNEVLQQTGNDVIFERRRCISFSVTDSEKVATSLHAPLHPVETPLYVEVRYVTPFTVFKLVDLFILAVSSLLVAIYVNVSSRE